MSGGASSLATPDAGSDVEERVLFRTCPLCEAACGLEITVQGERVEKIRGDRSHVLSRGFVCPKAFALAELHEDPDRLRRPLVKRGGHHVEVGWEEAYAEVESGLMPLVEEYGRDSIGVYLGNPNVHNHGAFLYLPAVLESLGTTNRYSSSTVDQMPRHVSAGLMFGSPFAMAVPDLDHTDFLLLLGTNPFESNGSLCTAPDFPRRMRAIRERGGRVVVVDPRRTRTARAADEHVSIRPGADALLLVAMIQVVLEADLCDWSRLGAFVKDLEVMAEAVSAFRPEQVADRCGVTAARIRALAVGFASAERAAIHGRMGIHASAFGTLASWAVDVLSIVTGNLDRPGGTLFPSAAHSVPMGGPSGPGFETGRWKSRVRGLPETLGEFPVSTLADEILIPGAGQVRGLLTVAGNPALSTPHAGRLETALEALDFMVSVDIYLNETTRHADVILPPPSALERSHYDVVYTSLAVRNFAHYAGATFEAKGPAESEILAKLALIFGGDGATADPSRVDEMLIQRVLEGYVSDASSPVYGRAVQDLRAETGGRGGPDDLLDVMLRMGPYGDAFGRRAGGLSLARLEAHPHGIDLGPLAPRLPELLATPSSRIELAPPTILSDLERLEGERVERVGSGLLLVGRRDIRSNNSWMHNLPSLVSGASRSVLHVHPEDAARVGVEDGEEVIVASRVGRVRVVAKLTDEVMPGVVSLPHGWGHDRSYMRMDVARSHAGVNANLLTDCRLIDPSSGNGVLNGISVSLLPARESSRA